MQTYFHTSATLTLPALLCALVLAGCSDGGSKGDAGPGGGDGDMGSGMDGGGFDNAGDRAAVDASFVEADHFFIDDDPPPFCGPDGGMMPGQDPGGTDECPADKNRQGCPCEVDGEQAPCWPGRRDNRHHGQCHDGTATCYETEEFGKRWGPCEDYTLPDEDALRGAEACRCFSNGSWRLTNLSPCVVEYQHEYYLHSSSLQAAPGGGVNCPAMTAPPSAPDEPWSRSALQMDCGGQFRLCFTIKGGHVMNASDDDCVLAQLCQETWYETAGEELKLPDLPGWISEDTACAGTFATEGGYGEMSIQGLSRECTAVDDGEGKPLVFYRAGYCSPTCALDPTADGCATCSTGGAGDF